MFLLLLSLTTFREPAPAQNVTYQKIVNWLQAENVDLSSWWIDAEMPELMQHKPELRTFPLQHHNRKIMMLKMPSAAYGVFLLDAEGFLITPLIFESMAHISNPRVFAFEKRDYFSLQWGRSAGTGIQNTWTYVWYVSDKGMVKFWSGPDYVFLDWEDETTLIYEITHFVESRPGHLQAMAKITRKTGSFDKPKKELWCKAKQINDLDDFSANDPEHLSRPSFFKWWCIYDIETNAAIPEAIRADLTKAACKPSKAPGKE